MSKLLAAITSDIDSLESIYKGQGCRREGGYTRVEMRMGLENFHKFLEPYQVLATLFMVGNDMKYPVNQPSMKAMADAGHEIANHSMTHAQGFRLLSEQEKEAELAGMEEICLQVTGVRPVGFRSPGWNVGDDALPILKRRGYIYDSSVHPTSLMPILKIMHWYTMRDRSAADRTTMGSLRYMFAPVAPYRTSTRSLAQKGQNGIVEFPITVTPVLRLPFFATFLVSTGMELFRASLCSLKAFGYPLQFQFHLSDFVDYNHPDLADQVPLGGHGQYVPRALRIPLANKLRLFREVMDMLMKDYTFITLKEWSVKVGYTHLHLAKG
ncbi:MAG: polysaccharide deacetylase family protein [Chloroflexi bacterium]|nr:polysaccharide deacetylase family protein [Chloroflexota bacterium]